MPLTDFTELTEAMVTEMLHSALRKAEELGIEVSAAVTDKSGYLLGFLRHPTAELVSVMLAQNKAYTSAVNRVSTAKLGRMCQPGEELYGLQHTGNGQFVIFGGGLPIRDSQHRLIGAIGVSGGTTEQDEACARHAILQVLPSQH